jgi:hypothetical protein
MSMQSAISACDIKLDKLRVLICATKLKCCFSLFCFRTCFRFANFFFFFFSRMKLVAATDFAAKAHTTQRRKDTAKTPYINHPISVCHEVAKAGCLDEDVLAAAMLHDVVEDCGVGLEELRLKFGDRVAHIVQECSDDKALPKGKDG